MNGVKITNMVRFCTLMLLSGGKKHGYEIIKDLELHLGRKISASHVYPFLKTLEKNKLVERKNIGKRKEYTLTAEGRKFSRGFFSKSAGLMKIAIEPSVSSCAHCGCKVLKGGVGKEDKGRKLAFCCKYCANSYFRKK